MAADGLPQWLEELQKDIGITYMLDDAEERLRAVFNQVCADVQQEVQTIRYYGYREQPLAQGGRVRVILKKLSGNIVLPDGSRYFLELTGPYEQSSEDAGR